MKNHLKQYQVTLRTLSPVFIGSGDDIKKTEFILDKDSALIMDNHKLLRELANTRLIDSYVNSILDGHMSLWNWSRVNNVPISFFREAALYALDVADVPRSELTRSGILTFIKDPYKKPYIPGSSLKGAVRNILLGTKIKKLGFEKDRIETALNENDKDAINSEKKRLETKMFHPTTREETRKSDAVNDMMRGVRFSDSKPLSLESLTVCKKIDIHCDGSDKSLNLLRESLKPGTKVEFDLTIDQTETEITAKEILNSIDEFYADYRELFLNAFNYDGAHRELAIDGNHIIFIGGGSGYPSKTVMNQIFCDDTSRIKYVSKAIQFGLTKGKRTKEKTKDHSLDEELGVSPRTIKMTEYNNYYYQMGACELSIQER